MSTAWSHRSPERDDSHILGIAEPVRLVPKCQPCRNCGSFTDAGEILCPTCLKDES